jgi:hypothetical protein
MQNAFASMKNFKALTIDITYLKVIDFTKFLPEMHNLRRLKIREDY